MQFTDLKMFANHLQKAHKMSSREYTVTHLCGGKEPVCAICGAPTRYVSFMFKPYCALHANQAQRDAGKAHGRGRPKIITLVGRESVDQLVDFIVSLGFDVSRDHTLDCGHVVDVFVADRNVAVDINELTRGETRREHHDKKAGLKKKAAIDASGTRFLQFFTDEWVDRRDVCESMVRNALGRSELSINARDCALVELSTSEAKEFFDVNHLAGYSKASTKLGLKHPVYGIVSACTLRVPWQKKYGNVVELGRMASRLNTTVRGASSKLLSRAVRYAKEKGYVGVLTYAELRHGTGNVYELCGFKRLGLATGNYWYTDGQRRFDRFGFRAQDGMTEKEYTASKNVWPVYGVGNAVFMKELL
jgi:GNAT superfamily N-acetyltransferase